ncbi:apoptosis-inducing factor [Acrasis kona]|uniref:Apoptosis-inducing factor n=1 Tax=Acrasis kona TaxID=1008807 RepID=A0AAW2ZS15_9EUKA
MPDTVPSIRVVVVGGGVSGILFTSGLFRRLGKNFHLHVTIIDKKPYFEYIGTGTLRAMFNPSHHDNMVNPGFTKTANGHELEVLHGKVLTNIDKTSNTITLRDNASSAEMMVEYDYLYIATGCSYSKFPILKPDFGSIEERRSQLEEFSQQIKAAPHVIIIGGGSFACELLGELNDYYPNIPITLVNTRPNMLDRAPQGAHDYVMRFVDKANAKRKEDEKIKVILNDMVHLKTNTTNKGVELPTNALIFSCYGAAPNTSGFGDFNIPLTAEGHIKVDLYFKVEGTNNIYALGDVNNIAEEKMAATARLQAKVASTNLANLIQGKPKQIEYEPKEMVQVVSLGKKDGMMIKTSSIAGTGRMFGWMKGKVENLVLNTVRNPESLLSKQFY